VKLLPLVGAALVVRKLSMRTVDYFYIGGFLIAALAGLFFHAPSLIIILLTVTGGWLGARYGERRS
jgi:mannose/fructose/N-acetylgalactosamine-specific phosphotransferase system component IIC